MELLRGIAQTMTVMWRKKRIAVLGLAFLLLLMAVALFADFLAPTPMQEGALPSNLAHILERPYFMLDAAGKQLARSSGAVFLMGTDNLGRDVLSYIIYGTRTSVVLCLSVMVISTLVSVLIGTMSAVIGGGFDIVVQRLVDAWLCIPNMLLTIILMNFFGNGLMQLIFVMAVPAGIGGSRIIRSSAIAVRNNGYVTTSDLLGGGIWWKTFRHVIPNTLPLIITTAAGSLAGVVMQEASLNFLGYGVAPGTPSWGYMITNQGRANMYNAPWLCIIPGIMIVLMVLAANMFADGVRDVLDPRLKGGIGTYNTIRAKVMAMKDRRQIARRKQFPKKKQIMKNST